MAGRDDEGDASFWKKLAAAVAVVAVVAVVAAATAATGGALCAAATVVAGAAKGALVGAVVGAATGAVTGGVQGAVEGYKETGTLEGTLRGMGKGAAKGALEGAKDGLISGMVMGGVSSGISAMSGNPSFCFVAGTTVLTTLGKKAIETIQVGDTVPCVDHITGEATEKKVVSTSVNKVTRLIELEINGDIIQCTETHPFQVKGKGWIDACELHLGDIVYTKDWNTATVNSIGLLELDEPVEVFNFEVEDFHTYFIGDTLVLVHNALCSNHGNSLNTTKPAEGYILKDKTTHEILKYGETTRGKLRYTKKYLDSINAEMEFVKKGTKSAMHTWQHNMIEGYTWITGQKPPLNRSYW